MMRPSCTRPIPHGIFVWHAKTRFKRMDIDKNGYLSIEDYNELTKHFNEYGNLSGEDEQKIHKAMQDISTKIWHEGRNENNAGTVLDRTEYFRCLHKYIIGRVKVKQIEAVLMYGCYVEVVSVHTLSF